MRRNIACAYLIVERAVRQEMQQFATRHVVLGIHQVEVAVRRMYDDAVGHTHIL